jgi:hypothetical protein
MKSFPDRRLKKIDEICLNIVAEQFQKHINLVGVHLRDARNLLLAVKKDDRILAKGAIVLASAAIEANLEYFCQLAIEIRNVYKHELYLPPELFYLKGVEAFIDEKGELRERPQRQKLEERLLIVPKLLGKAFDRDYQLSKTKSAAFKKLRNTIERRDAIIHPRWDKYLEQIGWFEAAEAVDGVELYLHSVQLALHPYLVGFFSLLFTMRGYQKDDVSIAYRTWGRRGRPIKFVAMETVGVSGIISQEWLESLLWIEMAMHHDTERDSNGSMFTRAALILLYSMIDAQLAIVSQMYLQTHRERFSEAEALFLLERAVGIGTDGELFVSEDHQSFKQRLLAVPRILSRAVNRRDLDIQMNQPMWQKLMEYHTMRNLVVHSSSDATFPRVSKAELFEAWESVLWYFSTLANLAPDIFGFFLKLDRKLSVP